MARLKAHLIRIGAWSEDRQRQMQAEVDAEVLEAAKQAEAFGTLHDGPKPSAASMFEDVYKDCLLYTSPSPRDGLLSRMPSSA